MHLLPRRPPPLPLNLASDDCGDGDASRDDRTSFFGDSKKSRLYDWCGGGKLSVRSLNAAAGGGDEDEEEETMTADGRAF